MQRIALEIAIVIFVYVLGYWMGFRACYDYLMDELKKHKKGQDELE